MVINGDLPSGNDRNSGFTHWEMRKIHVGYQRWSDFPWDLPWDLPSGYD